MVCIRRENDKVANTAISIILSDLELLILSTGNPLKRMNLKKAIKEIRDYQINRSSGKEMRLLPDYLTDKLDNLFWNLAVLGKGNSYPKYYDRVITHVIQRYDILVNFLLEIKN